MALDGNMKEKGGLSIGNLIPWIAVAALLAVAPYIVNAALVSFLFFFLMWVALSQSFNLFTGLTGYVNFGFVVFYGLGGYGMTLSLLRLNLPIYLALLVGGLIAAAFAMVVSLPVLRLRGAYFAIAMLSLAQAVFVIFDNWNFVNSATGYTIPVQYYNPQLQYYAMLVIAAATCLAVYLVMHSKLGLALRAIKQNEEAAVSLGVNSTLYKSITLAISGFFAGLAGGAAIWAITIIDPPSAFDTTVTLTVISMTMLGGFGTLLGPIIGSAILYSVEYYLGLTYPYLHLIIFGAIIIGTVLAMPHGIMGVLREYFLKGRVARATEEEIKVKE
ncbi:MAG: branched-chain amino acid ABC transporter permease [Conexivisphaerales archaeon]